MVAMTTMHSEKKLTLLCAQFIKLVRYIDCCIDKGLEGGKRQAAWEEKCSIVRGWGQVSGFVRSEAHFLIRVSM